MASFGDILRSALQNVARAAKTTAAGAGLGGVTFEPGTRNAFVYGGGYVSRAGSSNVLGYQYDYKRRIMTVRFKGNKTYQYYNVPQAKAELLFDAGSAGGAVWDLFRIRGSKYLHQHPFLRTN